MALPSVAGHSLAVLHPLSGERFVPCLKLATDSKLSKEVPASSRTGPGGDQFTGLSPGFFVCLGEPVPPSPCPPLHGTCNLLDIKFARIGARLKVADRPSRRFRTAGGISLDVQTDRKGEFFEIVRQAGADASVEVLDVQPADRHLLLLVREGKDKSKYLCGHDERHWFVAGIPDKAPVGTVRQAKEALKPADVRTAQARQGINGKARNRPARSYSPNFGGTGQVFCPRSWQIAFSRWMRT